MKKFASVSLLFLLFVSAIFPCGPGYISPLFDRRYEPEIPYENFAAGKIGIIKPSLRRVVLFAAYRYLNNGNFTADEQKSLVDVWNMEFNNKDFADDDVGEVLKIWIEKRSTVVGKEEKIPEIYAERSYGGYDFFPNCTKNAFETATQTLSDRIASHGSDDKDVKSWVDAQDKVFMNCASGKQTPEAPDASMPEWLQKDRVYQIAAAEFYSLDYEKAKTLFREISADGNSPWQDTADYLVGRTLIRQASLTRDVSRSTQFYNEAEQHLQNYSGKYRDSAEKLLGLIKYRLRPETRVGELGRSLSYGGTQNFRQDLIDYNWLLDKFEKDALDAEEKRKEALKPKDGNKTAATNTAVPQQDELSVEIYLYTDDYSQNWRIFVNPNASDAEALTEAEKVVGRPLTDKMKERFLDAKRNAYTRRYTENYQSGYQGGYYGEEKTSLSILPAFLRQDDLTDWLFTFQIKGAEAYLYSLSKFRQSGSDLWLLTALSKADKNSSELNSLLEAAGKASRFSPAYPTIAFHTARILIEQNKAAEARKMLDDVLDSSIEMPVSSRNQFLALRTHLAETLDDFLKYAQRKSFAIDWGGQAGTVEDIIAEQKAWYDAESYAPQTREEFDHEVEERFKEERLWQDREMFDEKTTEVINEHFPLALLVEVEKSPVLPDYLRKRFAAAIWTRAVILDDFATAQKIAPEVIKFAPETEDLMNDFLLAKTPIAKKRAALYLILKVENLTPYVTSGMGTSTEGYRMYAERWWCEPYEGGYDEENEVYLDNMSSQKPSFLSQIQSDTAQKELRKLKSIGDASKFLGTQVLEWARLAPLDKRVPESLYIVYEASGWDKYGCGNNEELQAEIGALLKKRYPNSEWTAKIIDEAQ